MLPISEYSTAVHLAALCTLGEVPPRLFDRLLIHLGSTEAILSATEPVLLGLDGITPELAARVLESAQQLERAADFVALLAEREIRTISRFDTEYSHLLNELNDPPPLLFVRGSMPVASRKSVGLIGTSHSTAEGIELTTSLADSFARAGVQVVSTLRGGTDVAAHIAAKTAGGSSFAVLDCGFDEVDSPEIVPVAIDIVERGGVISEYVSDHEATPDTMLASNRLVVGLSQAVVVTEVYDDSEFALDILAFCRDIGKLAFLAVDPDSGVHADETSLHQAVECGAIPMTGANAVNEIIRSLV